MGCREKPSQHSEYHPLIQVGAERSTEAGIDQNICHTPWMWGDRAVSRVCSCIKIHRTHKTRQLLCAVSYRKAQLQGEKACKYRPTFSRVINYTKSAFSIQICSLIPYGAHLAGPAVKWFKQSPSGGSRSGTGSPVAWEGCTGQPQLPQPSPILLEPVKWVRLSLQTPTAGAEEEFWLSRGRWEEKVWKQGKNDGGDGSGGRAAVQTDITGWRLICKARVGSLSERKVPPIRSTPKKSSRWPTSVQLVEVFISSQ